MPTLEDAVATGTHLDGLWRISFLSLELNLQDLTLADGFVYFHSGRNTTGQQRHFRSSTTAMEGGVKEMEEFSGVGVTGPKHRFRKGFPVFTCRAADKLQLASSSWALARA